MFQQTQSSEQEFSVGVQVALRSYMLNSAVNPYIIGFFNSQFRAYVKEVMCKCVRKWHTNYRPLQLQVPRQRYVGV